MVDDGRINEAFDKAETHLELALKELRTACKEIGKHMSIPYHMERARLELKHAAKRLRIRRTRMED